MSSDSHPLLAPKDQQAIPKIPIKVYIFVMLSALGGVLFGFEMSVISGAKEDMPNKILPKDNSGKVGLVASVMTLGAAGGTILAGQMQEIIGRRYTTATATLVYLGCAVLTTTAQNFTTLVMGRLFTGVTIGIFSSTIFLYTAELAPTAIRGALLTVNQLFICIGILIGYVVDKFVAGHHSSILGFHHKYALGWRDQLRCGMPIAVVLLISMLFITPKSPRWLIKKGRKMEAYRVLSLLRGGSQAASNGSGGDDGKHAWWVEAEAAEIQQSVDMSRGGWRKLMEPHILRALALGILLSAIQQFTGVNAINFYAQTVLEDAGFKKSEAFTESIVIGVVKVVMVMAALLMMDKFGRKTLLLVGLAGMVVSTAILGSVLMTNPSDEADISKTRGWTAACSLFLFMGFFEIGLGPVVWILISEFYPLSVRGTAMSVGATANWIFTYTVGQAFPPLKRSIGAGGVFFLFGAIGILSAALIFLFVPETKGLPLEQIEDLFRSKKERRQQQQQQQQQYGGHAKLAPSGPGSVNGTDDEHDGLIERF